VGLALLAAIMSAISTYVAKQTSDAGPAPFALGPWIAVVTTIGGSIAAYAAASRYTHSWSMQEPSDAGSADAALAGKLAAAQLEKLDLEILKLRAEVHRLSWRSTVAALTPLLSVIVGVIGFLFGVYQFQAAERAQQERALTEQRRSDATARLTQNLQLQSRIREDVELLLQFFNDDKQTLSGISFVFDTLETHLGVAAEAAQRDKRVLFTDRRTITSSLIRAVEDDCDLSRYRHAAFVTVLGGRWPDYGDFLKSHPEHLRYIADQYVDAAQELRRKSPEAFRRLGLDADETLAWRGGRGTLTVSDLRHFDELILGMQQHLLLFSKPEDKKIYARRFAAGIGGDAFASWLLAD